MFKSINGGLLPQRATKHSAGFDVFANEDMVIGAGETKLVGLGISLCNNLLGTIFGEAILDFYEKFYLELHPRSSLRANGLVGGVGIIDIDYKNEIKMIIHNPLTIDADFDYSYKNYAIKKGDKIGQLILKRHEGWLLPAEYTKDEERIGGFGSTDEV